MKKLHWETVGNGNINLILLHGWGLNNNVWLFIIKKLSNHFKLYLVDLPGFGYSNALNDCSFDEISEILFQTMPKKSIWLGWSMGGLFVNNIGLNHSKQVIALINICSSPCFISKKNWPGIANSQLMRMFNQLNKNYKKIIDYFIDIQNQQTKEKKLNIDFLKKIISSKPIPEINTLKNGLKILKNIDLREKMIKLKIPLLRIYGELDNLVPIKINNILNIKWPNTYSYIIKKSGHTPFISSPEVLCNILIKFKEKIKMNLQ
ncbi:pimeloyl-ACP methyl ester esterase BioH [Buchnera aphidicola (Neophyllaphis podocarpi)]|uniref:pimeloyl-ACP methyl ester esterase BioH n=1 Tax=Buchnera aphidicola TaxID=9 RepID=UPI0031B82366